MRYFILFFIVAELVYASLGFCFTIPKEMTKLKNEDDDFAFFLQRVDESLEQMKGEVWLILTIIPKKPERWENSEVSINIFNGNELIVKASINELEEYEFVKQIGERPEGASRYFVSISPKYLEHSYLYFSTFYAKDIEEKKVNGLTQITITDTVSLYMLKFKDFIKIETREEVKQ